MESNDRKQATTPGMHSLRLLILGVSMRASVVLGAVILASLLLVVWNQKEPVGHVVGMPKALVVPVDFLILRGMGRGL